MGTGAVGGIGSVPEFADPEGPALEGPLKGEVSAGQDEPQVVRGSTPWSGLGDGAGTLVQADLEERTSSCVESSGKGTSQEQGALESTGLEQSQGTQSVTEVEAPPRTPQEIEAEIEALEALEAAYEAWLEDPDLSSYERYFIEMDLYDVRSEIFDLKVELGSAIADSWWNSFGLLGAGLLDCWDAMISLFQTKSRGMIQMLDQQQQIVERGQEEAHEAEHRRRITEAIQRAAAESGALVPPVSSEILAILDRHRDAVERFAKAPSPEQLPAVREAIRAVTGERRAALLEAARAEIARKRQDEQAGAL